MGGIKCLFPWDIQWFCFNKTILWGGWLGIFIPFVPISFSLAPDCTVSIKWGVIVRVIGTFLNNLMAIYFLACTQGNFLDTCFWLGAKGSTGVITDSPGNVLQKPIPHGLFNSRVLELFSSRRVCSAESSKMKHDLVVFYQPEALPQRRGLQSPLRTGRMIACYNWIWCSGVENLTRKVARNCTSFSLLTSKLRHCSLCCPHLMWILLTIARPVLAVNSDSEE